MSKNEAELEHINELLVAYGTLPTGANKRRIIQLITAYAERQSLLARRDEWKRLGSLSPDREYLEDRLNVLNIHLSKDQLMSDEELRRNISDLMADLMIESRMIQLADKSSMLQQGKDFIKAHNDRLNSILDLFNTQKRLYAESEKTKARIDEQETVVEGLFEQVGEGNVMEYDLAQVLDRSENRLKELRAEQRARIKS